ncbi:MAG: HAD family hydrolase [Verrucomicrobia bacterium]|nr:HAD family hydrolase [Verrucomicrobiota bacterium]
MKPLLILDLDGTLVDSLTGIATSLNHSLAEHKQATHPPSAVRYFVGDGVVMLVKRALGEAHEPTLAASVIDGFKDHYDANWKTGTHPYEGITETLESLSESGYPLAVLSNKPHAFTTAMTTRVFPKIKFAAVLGQRDGIPNKPEPQGALEIAKKTGHAPQDCIVIGDSTMDLETARRAGMRAIAVTWGYHDRNRLVEAGATHMIDHPNQLNAACIASRLDSKI